MSEDWDSKTVIGYKRQTAKVTTKNSDLNGAHPLFSCWNSRSDLSAPSRTSRRALPTPFTLNTHSGSSLRRSRRHRQEGRRRLQQSPCWFVTTQTAPPYLGSPNVLAGTDHQRIAKLDRENEVAPPPKIAPSVGRVSPWDIILVAF